MRRSGRDSSAAALGLILLIGGCATFEGRQLPRAERTSAGPCLVSGYSLDVSFYPSFLSALTDRGEARRFVADRIALVFEASGLVAKPEKLDQYPNVPPVRLAVHVAFRRNDFFCYTTGWTSTFSWGIVPGYCRETFVLIIDERRGDSLERTYQYRDYTSDWLHLSMLAFADRSTMRHTPEAAARFMGGLFQIGAYSDLGVAPLEKLIEPPFLSSMQGLETDPVAARVLDNIL